VGCRPEESPLKLTDGRYSIDFEDFERRINHETNTMIHCNPQNPTGNCWSPADLTRVGEICLRRRVVVLADEIHCDFVTKGNHYTPFCTLPNKDIVRNSLTFKAASKSFGLAAMKSAWMFSYNADYIARVKANHRPELNTMGIIANHAAYAGGEEWLDQLVAYIDGNHDFVEAFIRSNMPLVKHVKPQATYLTWLDVSQALDKIGAKDLAAAANRTKAANARPVTPEKVLEDYLVKHARIQINPGTSYGLGGAGHMRMNIATSRKELALTNMANALKMA
jgi:cystathionine beta-lyase